MIKIKCPLILASGSPRRKDILQTMGLNFTIDVSDADEDFTGAPDETVMELSLRKAKAVAPRHEDAYVLAADTLVYNGALLGKPGSYEKSIEMLKALRGQWHSVFTGITLIHHRSGNVIQRACETRIHFVDMTDEDIHAYVMTGEPLDKAGAYAIQGLGGMFIDRIEGSYSNAVGLPMADVREMICEMNELV